MSRSTGPILATGGIAWANAVVFADNEGERPDDLLRFTATIGVATGVAAVMLSGFERISEQLAVGIGWLALMSLLLVRVRPNTPTPVERVLAFAT